MFFKKDLGNYHLQLQIEIVYADKLVRFKIFTYLETSN